MKISVFWADEIIALMMRAGSPSEHPVNIYQTTSRDVPQGDNLYSRSREDLKSQSRNTDVQIAKFYKINLSVLS